MTALKSEINFLVVPIIGIAAFSLSGLWYSSLVFGKIWKLYRLVPNPDIPRWTIIVAPLRELSVCYVIAYLIVRMDIKDWKVTARLMLMLWFAFHAVGMAGAILWDNMQWQLGAVHAGDWLMKMLFMGITLTLWLNKKMN